MQIVKMKLYFSCCMILVASRISSSLLISTAAVAIESIDLDSKQPKSIYSKTEQEYKHSKNLPKRRYSKTEQEYKHSKDLPKRRYAVPIGRRSPPGDHDLSGYYPPYPGEPDYGDYDPNVYVDHGNNFAEQNTYYPNQYDQYGGNLEGCTCNCRDLSSLENELTSLDSATSRRGVSCDRSNYKIHY
jgi:hypothetical protein